MICHKQQFALQQRKHNFEWSVWAVGAQSSLVSQRKLRCEKWVAISTTTQMCKTLEGREGRYDGKLASLFGLLLARHMSGLPEWNLTTGICSLDCIHSVFWDMNTDSGEIMRNTNNIIVRVGTNTCKRAVQKELLGRPSPHLGADTKFQAAWETHLSA